MSPRELPILKTPRLVVRLARQTDAPDIVDYFARNRDFLRATDPQRPPEFFCTPYWEEQITRSLQEFYRDSAVRFFLFDANESRVIGTANFTQIFRGPFQAGYLGYGIDEEVQGQGLMTEALHVALRYMFDDLNLHRIMANYMPHNERSAAVLKRLGFVIEGQARDYIRVAGEWRDHVLTSLVNTRWVAPTVRE